MLHHPPLRISDRVWSLFKSSSPRVPFFNFSFYDGVVQIATVPKSVFSVSPWFLCVSVYSFKSFLCICICTVMKPTASLFPPWHRGRVWSLLRASLFNFAPLRRQSAELLWNWNVEVFPSALNFETKPLSGSQFIYQELKVKLSSGSESRVVGLNYCTCRCGVEQGLKKMHSAMD